MAIEREPKTDSGGRAARPSANKRTRVLLTVVLAVAFLVVAVVGVAIVAAPHDGAADPDREYTSAEFGDACALWDMSALEKVVGAAAVPPRAERHEEPVLMDLLSCHVVSERGFSVLQVEVYRERSRAARFYENRRSVELAATGPGVTVRPVTGYGERTHMIVRAPTGDEGSGCTLGILRANVTISIAVNRVEDTEGGAAELERICRAQADSVLDRVR